jgi:predicted RND superfamily exporter protein
VSVALRDTGRPIATGALAGLAFLALLASGFPPVRWFGALACAGVLAATALVLVLTPALARRFPVRVDKTMEGDAVTVRVWDCATLQVRAGGRSPRGFAPVESHRNDRN